MLTRAHLAALFVVAVFGAAPLHGQVRPDRPWRTLETTHFRFHTPLEFEGWTRSIAVRMESVHEAVRSKVGSAPTERIDVVVDDPSNVANGSAYPILDGPALFLWPTPPDPRSGIGKFRSWGELLAVHEFAHLAHLNREPRNVMQRLGRRIFSRPTGPLRGSPRWMSEGYATYIEGVLTGTGRPHSPTRAAILRQWALEGVLPNYTQLSLSGGYNGGSFAYHQGAAFIEWLGARNGDSSITAIFRRQSAVQKRTFVSAFTGVYGESPSTLYSNFVAEQTADAFRLRDVLAAAGVVTGTTVQRLTGNTGDPAVSPDGSQIALVVSGVGGPASVRIWKTEVAPRDSAADSAAARRARQQRARDPEDVPTMSSGPPPRTAVHTLRPVMGRGHQDPRWFADGERLLVWRLEPLGDGAARPDLFIWTPKSGALHRVTTGASVRQADPHPDGTRAAAVRCTDGRCDLMLVDLRTGAVSAVLPPVDGVTWGRPRWSPDGASLVASRHVDARWRVTLVDVRTGALRDVGPDDQADRYDAAFADSGRALVYTSELGGVPNITQLELASGVEQALTRVTGAAFAPEPLRTSRDVLFLHQTSRGMDLHRVAPDSTPVVGLPVVLAAPNALLARTTSDAVRASLAPRGTQVVDTFAIRALTADRPFTTGPRGYVVSPFGGVAVDGAVAGGQITSTDPIGRLSWSLQGVRGEERRWEGGALRTTWRRFPITVSGELFGVGQSLAATTAVRLPAVAPTLTGAQAWHGGALIASAQRLIGAGALPVRADVLLGARGGAATGVLAQRDGGLSAPDRAGHRQLVFGDVHLRVNVLRGVRPTALTLTGHHTLGRTFGEGWERAVATAELRTQVAGRAWQVEGALGTTSRTAPVIEQFALGGIAPGLVDDALFSQRVAIDALPQASVIGTRMTRLRVSTPLAQGLEAYGVGYQAGSAIGGRLSTLAGLELRTTTAAIPYARIPASSVISGVAYHLDGALRDRVFGYVGMRFTP
jgi:hypothetical protein